MSFSNPSQRANFLRKNPQEQKNPNELENLMKYIHALTSPFFSPLSGAYLTSII
jgi:hypothetical protein